MSIEAFVWVMNNSPSRLAERLVMYSIADHANPEGENAYPSVARIATEQNLSRRQVQRCLQNLIKSGEIFTAPRPDGPTPMYVIRGIQRPHCFYCGMELFSWDITQDHKIPKSRGGTNAPENLVPCCRTCNSTKHAMTVEEFREYKKLDRFPGEGGSTHPNLFAVGDRMSYWYDKSDIKMTKMSPEPSFNRPLTVKREEKSYCAAKPAAHPPTLPEFESFFEQYPRPLGKAQAKKAWVKNLCEGHLGEILLSLAAWAKLPQWADKQFIPYPATWLNQKRFLETPAEEVAGNGTRQSTTSREQQRRDRSAEAIERALGTRGRLVEALRANVPRGDHGRNGAALPGSVGGHPPGNSAQSLSASGKELQVPADPKRGP